MKAGTESAAHELPPASLIISSRNRPVLLAETIQAVLEGTRVPAEIVVVDQSDEEHPDLGRLPLPPQAALRYVWTPDRGLSRGRNLGIRVSAQPLLGFLDDDCVPAPAWFETLIETLARAGPRTVVFGRVVAGAAEVAGAFVPTVVVGTTAHDFRGRQRRDPLVGGNMAARRSAFDEVGLFDERLGAGARFPAAEDNDLGYRLLEAGYVIRYAPGATVVHRAWRSGASELAMRWAYGRGQGAFYAKHLRSHRRHMARRLTGDLARNARRLRDHVRNDRHASLNYLVYSLGLLAGAFEWLARRHR